MLIRYESKQNEQTKKKESAVSRQGHHHPLMIVCVLYIPARARVCARMCAFVCFTTKKYKYKTKKREKKKVIEELGMKPEVERHHLLPRSIHLVQSREFSDARH